MEIVRSFTIDDTSLTASSIGDTDDYALYSGATTYALGDIVVGTDHHEYESLDASNTGNALSDAAFWLDKGMNRKWRMFDLSNSTQSTDADSIDVTVQVDGRANAVSLLNIAADTAQIIVTTATDGEIYNQTFDLTSDSGINNWYDYFFEPIVRIGDLVITDLPLNGDPEIEVIATATGSTVKIGTLVIGQSIFLGATVYGARLGIQDYSRKVTDDFGNWTIVERAFSKKADYKVWMDNAKIDAAAAFLATIRAVPCVYKGDGNYSALYIFGFFKDWNIEIPGPNKSYLNLSIEGLT
jgi:hypothetical protein